MERYYNQLKLYQNLLKETRKKEMKKWVKSGKKNFFVFLVNRYLKVKNKGGSIDYQLLNSFREGKIGLFS